MCDASLWITKIRWRQHKKKLNRKEALKEWDSEVAHSQTAHRGVAWSAVRCCCGVVRSSGADCACHVCCSRGSGKGGSGWIYSGICLGICWCCWLMSKTSVWDRKRINEKLCFTHRWSGSVSEWSEAFLISVMPENQKENCNILTLNITV